MSMHRRLLVALACLALSALAALALSVSHGPALATYYSPPTAVCTGQCQSCLEFSGPDARCMKCGIDPKCLGGDPGMASDFTDMLAAHNAYRARHGVPALTWSPQLAVGAQAWADACTPEPGNPNRFAHSREAWASAACCGENLYWGVRTDANDAVDWWYGEIKQYNFNSPLDSFQAGDRDSSKEVRHFTQVVWRGSTQLGCGVATCGERNLWVCRYAPTGNYNAQSTLATNVPRPLGAAPASQSKIPMPGPGGGQAKRGEWSAFATDARGNWGYGAHWVDQQTAQKLAINGCGGAGIGCKVFWTTRDRCVAYTESRAGGYWYAAGGGGSRQQAIQNAIRFCQSGAAPANSCKSIVAECR